MEERLASVSDGPRAHPGCRKGSRQARTPRQAHHRKVGGNLSAPAGRALQKPLLDVRPAYLNASFDEVEEEYGSFRTYLRKGLGLDQQDLKELKRDLLVG
ncbi:tyrosine-protein phosphatase [Streptomyces sp. NPDC056501]|uniref:tyrosine-protein phosphatase n=1 Tax=Streptomyces sp. NPDC056501 TaxID=3345841 RepID=UPI0036B43CA7